ncbi:uncharacterized protein PG986_012211 [Apiospora aurea]|uniref:C2H2-type domain-containing protein n=1 Tax=Apiospora aurea TaxID=335848 RepID=A0ABR1PZD0_9PEZI
MGRSGYDISGMTSFGHAIGTPVSICTEATEDLEEEHPLYTVRTQFLHVVMAAHKRAAHDLDDISPDDGAGGGKGPMGPLECDNSNADEPLRKRIRSSDGGSSTLGSGEKQSGTKATNKRRTPNRRLWLACPFAKKDPVRYRSCYRYYLGRIRDVKQHLTRCHRKPFYCPICWKIFEEEKLRDDHVRLGKCPRRPEVEIEGISEQQKKELGQRVSPKMPEEQQWFTVFNILFPLHPRPRSPYIDRDLSEQMSVFHDFYTSKGPELLLEFLESTGTVTWNLPQEERDLSTFQEGILGDGLLHIWDHWTSANSIEETCDAEPGTPAASQSHDSGVALQDLPGKSSTPGSQQDSSHNGGFSAVETLETEIPRVVPSTKAALQVPTIINRHEEHSFLQQEFHQTSQEPGSHDWSDILPFRMHAGTDSILHDDILSQVLDSSIDGLGGTFELLPDFDFGIAWEK